MLLKAPAGEFYPVTVIILQFTIFEFFVNLENLLIQYFKDLGAESDSFSYPSLASAKSASEQNLVSE